MPSLEGIIRPAYPDHRYIVETIKINTYLSTSANILWNTFRESSPSCSKDYIVYFATIFLALLELSRAFRRPFLKADSYLFAGLF